MIGPMDLTAKPFIILIFLFALTAYGYSHKPSRESYEVYDAVIRTMFADDRVTFDLGGPKVTQFVIRANTVTGFASSDKKESWDVLVKPRFKNLSSELIDSYTANAMKAFPLKRKFRQKLPYTLISNEELDAFFSDKNPDWMDKKWKRFYEKYPGSHGYISFSNIGFNKAKDRALVYFVHWCMALCGTGHYISLSKQNDRWDVLEHARIWIS